MSTCSLLRRPSITALLLLGPFLGPTTSADAQSPRIVPRHPSGIELPEVGRIDDDPSDCRLGDQIFLLGDIDNNGLPDWGTHRVRCGDFDHSRPTDVLIFLSRHGSTPTRTDALRLGLEDSTISVRFRGAGDFDGDGSIDVATSVVPERKDTATNPNLLGLAKIVVWWGDGSGRYSSADTMHLETGPEFWYARWGYGRDWNHDGIDDLLLSHVSDVPVYEDGPELPTSIIFFGSRDRWGTGETEPTWGWSWEGWPEHDDIQFVDQDVDGHTDLAFYTEGRGGGIHGSVSIIYGSPDHILDTAGMVTVRFDSAWGKFALLADITGDLVPELLINTGGQERLKAYVGFKGQRIEEQYGTGNEPGRPGEAVWWGKPWSSIPLPGLLHDGWASAGWSKIRNLGDGNLDGVGDVWVSTTPDIVCYTAGWRFDSLYDGWITVPGGSPNVDVVLNLGDITGEGIPTFAVQASQFDLIRLMQPSARVPAGGRVRPLVPGTDTPDTTTGVVDATGSQSASFNLRTEPNPSSGEVQILWEGPGTSSIILEILDPLGSLVLRETLPPGSRRFVWDASETFGGRYFVRITADAVEETIPLVIRR